jgi:hypothetical protein
VFVGAECAPPTYITVGSEVARVGAVVVSNECVAVETDVSSSTQLFMRAYCQDVVVVTSTTHTTITTGTTDTTATTTFASTSVAPLLTTTVTATDVTTTATTSTATTDGGIVTFGANEGGSAAFPLVIVAGCVAAVLFCWMIAFVVVVRVRRRAGKQTLVVSAVGDFPDTFTVNQDRRAPAAPVTGRNNDGTAAAATAAAAGPAAAAAAANGAGVFNPTFDPHAGALPRDGGYPEDAIDGTESIGDLSDFGACCVCVCVCVCLCVCVCVCVCVCE